MKFIITILLSSITTFSSYASDSMDGLKPKDFKNFFNKWKVVTVRYRKDNNELRVVYANKIAYKALKKNKKVFPEGSILGKVGIKSTVDELFPSSVIPNGVVRYQIMVKNSKKYKENHGWGYLLYGPNNRVNTEDVENQVKSCAACHEVAESRDYVFSKPFNFSSNLPVKKFLKFDSIDLSLLPKALTFKLDTKFKFVRVLNSAVSKSVFHGSLDEIIPALSSESYLSLQPSAMISNDQKMFTLVVNLQKECEENKLKGTLINVIKYLNEKYISEYNYCYTP